MEVVPTEGNNYIRKAETLEMLEYCILLDENGEWDTGRAIIEESADIIFENSPVTISLIEIIPKLSLLA
jgi:hypothetical protein